MNSPSSCPSFPSTRIIGMYYHAQFLNKKSCDLKLTMIRNGNEAHILAKVVGMCIFYILNISLRPSQHTRGWKSGGGQEGTASWFESKADGASCQQSWLAAQNWRHASLEMWQIPASLCLLILNTLPVLSTVFRNMRDDAGKNTKAFANCLWLHFLSCRYQGWI